MDSKIIINAKSKEDGSSEYRVISVRLKRNLLEQIDGLSAQSNRSRNEIVNLLLDAAIRITKIQE